MTQWQSKYTKEQRAAIIHAYCELRIRPAAKIGRMARAGELVPEAGGAPLPAFEIPDSTAIDIGKRADRKKAGGGLRADYARMPARDRAHALQLRLTALIEFEITRLEDQAATGRKPLDIKRLQELVRLLKELATVPDPSERRLPPVPGQKDPTATQKGPTTNGLGAGILHATDQSTSPSVRAKQSSPASTSTAPPPATDSTDHNQHNTPHDHNAHDSEPGSYEGGLVGAVVA